MGVRLTRNYIDGDKIVAASDDEVLYECQSTNCRLPAAVWTRDAEYGLRRINGAF
jgi:hypothetical protein